MSKQSKQNFGPQDKEFDYDSFSLIACKDQQLEAFINVFHHSPDNVAQDELGQLFGVVQVLDHSDQSSYLPNLIAQVIKKEYFAKQKRGPEKSFEAALHKANLALADLTQHEIIQWMGKFKAVMGVIQKDNFFFTQAGGGRIVLVRDQQITDISRGLDEENSHPMKTFSSVSSGKIELGDKLLFASDSVFDIFSWEDLKRHAKTFNTDEFDNLIKSTLESEGENVGALTVNIKEKSLAKMPEKKKVKKLNYFGGVDKTEKKTEEKAYPTLSRGLGTTKDAGAKETAVVASAAAVAGIETNIKKSDKLEKEKTVDEVKKEELKKLDKQKPEHELDDKEEKTSPFETQPELYIKENEKIEQEQVAKVPMKDRMAASFAAFGEKFRKDKKEVSVEASIEDSMEYSIDDSNKKDHVFEEPAPQQKNKGKIATGFSAGMAGLAAGAAAIGAKTKAAAASTAAFTKDKTSATKNSVQKMFDKQKKIQKDDSVVQPATDASQDSLEEQKKDSEPKETPKEDFAPVGEPETKFDQPEESKIVDEPAATATAAAASLAKDFEEKEKVEQAGVKSRELVDDQAIQLQEPDDSEQKKEEIDKEFSSFWSESKKKEEKQLKKPKKSNKEAEKIDEEPKETEKEPLVIPEELTREPETQDKIEIDKLDEPVDDKPAKSKKFFQDKRVVYVGIILLIFIAGGISYSFLSKNKGESEDSNISQTATEIAAPAESQEQVASNAQVLVTIGTEPNSMVTDDKELLIYSADNKFFSLNTENNKIKEIELDSKVKDVVQIVYMADLRLVFFLMKDNVVSFSPVTRKFVDNNITLSAGLDIAGAGTYLTFLYYLDRNAGQIYRYPRAEGGFGAKVDWLKETIDASAVNDMAIDDNIRLTYSDGKIEKYFKGKNEETAELNGDPKPVGSKIKTVVDGEFYYLLDVNQGKVIKVKKDGNSIEKEVTDVKFKEAVDFNVHSDGNQVYVTVKSGEVLKASF